METGVNCQIEQTMTDLIMGSFNKGLGITLIGTATKYKQKHVFEILPHSNYCFKNINKYLKKDKHIYVIIALKHSCSFIVHITSTEEKLQNSRLRRSFCNFSSVLVIWTINSQSCFIPIVAHSMKQWSICTQTINQILIFVIV